MVSLLKTTPTDYSILRPGTEGETVCHLQQKLNQRFQALGVNFAQIPEDGRFGPLTLRAVQYLQCIAFLPVNGIVDLQTWEFIEQGSDSLPELCLGSVGGLVWSVQNTMRSLRINVAADGHFGPQMLAQVKLFQKYSQLIPTGVIGPVTWCRLITLKIGHPSSYHVWQGSSGK